MRRPTCLLFLLFALLLLPAAAAAQTGTIDTVAGGGPNNLPALSANLVSPQGVAVDGAGNFYIAAPVNPAGQNRIFKVDTSGQLTVVAGTGTPGFSGDGGPATSASLFNPVGVAVDATGNLFIADFFNRRIRRVDATTGIITTVAGGGSSLGDGGPATSASLGPFGVALDSHGNLFVADLSNQRIRKVDTSTGIITTVAGNGISGFSGDGGPASSASLASPAGVAVDLTGNLFVADLSNQRIRRVDAATGTITTVAGNGTFGFSGDGGPATNARLSFPRGVAVDASGNLFIADFFNQRIRRVDAATGIITTAAGTGFQGFSGDGGPATSAGLFNPSGVAVDANGNLFIADQLNQRIRKVDTSTGIITTVAGNGTEGFSGDGGPATSASLRNPFGVAVGSNGNLYIADASNQRIRKVHAATGTITTVAGNGIFGFSGDGGPATSASLSGPSGVALDVNGNLYIADTENRRIRRVDAATGIITTVAGGGSSLGDGGPATSASLRPVGVAVDTNGNLFIADTGNQRIRRVDAATGTITTVAGNGTEGFSGDGGPAISARFFSPTGVAVDSNGNFFIADLNNRRIRRVDAATGTITTVAGNGLFGFSGDGGPATSASLANPFGVAVDSTGNLFIADFGDQRIRRVDAATGIITTVAGNGTFGFSGDGGPATSASLAFPFGVAVGAGNLFIADRNNHRIRRVSLNQPPVADAGPDRTVIVGEAVQFDGSGSSDPDGTIASYQWDFGDAGTAGGVASTHVYTAAGQFIVTLTVTDDQGATATDTASVTVQTQAEAIQSLTQLVQSFNFQQGISNSLDAKLENVLAALDAANAEQRQDAANKLQAFIQGVEAQRGKEITNAQADQLIALAQRILALL